MLKIGLTGGIGCGKSTVADLFAKLGAPIIDADIIARQLVEIGQPALVELTELFGKSILNDNSSLNRAALREIVFQITNRKKQLEAVLHPLIYTQIETEIASLNYAYCIICLPLLIETQKTGFVDRVLVIDCLTEQQIARVRERDDLALQQIESIIATQASRETKLAIADDIIDNSKLPSQLITQVKNLHLLYFSLSSD